MIVGVDGTANFSQSDGSNRVLDYSSPWNVPLHLSYSAGSSGTYILSGGSLSLYGYEHIGHSGTGTFIQTGGVHGLDSWGGSYGLTNDLILGYSAGSSGTYILSGGRMSAGDNLFVGCSGTGSFNQSGGVVSAGFFHNFILGSESEGSGTYTLSGGTLWNWGYSPFIGYSGSGTFNQSGGIHTVISSASRELTISANPGQSSGTYNLSGGTLTVNAGIINNDILNYSGGTLSASITNYGVTSLSGSGIRTINGDVINNRTFKTTHTTAVYTGTFTNNGAYISNSSLKMFADLIIGEDGYMEGNWEDLWYVKGALSWALIGGDSVTNIFGEEGMIVYYLASIPKNTYHGGLTYNLTGGGKLMPISAVPMLVEIDIKPGAYPNTINLGSKGKVPVAILTTDVFDAGTVDPTTVTFADAAPIKWEMVDVDNDGDIDLLLYFNIQEFKLDENSTKATLTVTIADVIEIIGTDSVKIVTKGKK